MKQRLTLVITAIIAALALPQLAHAQETMPNLSSSWQAGLKAGMLSPGAMDELDTTGGPLASASIDAYVAPKLTIGGYVRIARTETEGGTRIGMATIGATIKGRFSIGDGYELRPGVTSGYQKMSVNGNEASTGWDVGGVLELAIQSSGSREWLVELGFVSQPVGSVTFEPIAYLSVGIGWGR